MKPSPTQRHPWGKPKKMPSNFHKFGYFFAHKSYVTPASLVAKLLDERHYLLQARVAPLSESARYKAEYDDEGWLMFLSWEMAQMLRVSEEAVSRRLYDVRHGKAKVCNISFAEAICESLGMNLDIETNLPTLPGNKRLARELVAVRAEMAGVELSKGELDSLAEKAWRLSAIIVRNPERLERVQDMAPFDCLRSPV